MPTQVIAVTGAGVYTDWISVKTRAVEGYYGLNSALVSNTVVKLQIKNNLCTDAADLGQITSSDAFSVKEFTFPASFETQIRAGVSALATGNNGTKVFIDFNKKV